MEREGSGRFRDVTGGRDLGHVFLDPTAATRGDHVNLAEAAQTRDRMPELGG